MTKTANDISDDNCSIVDLSNAALDITLQTRHVGPIHATSLEYDRK